MDSLRRVGTEIAFFGLVLCGLVCVILWQDNAAKARRIRDMRAEVTAAAAAGKGSQVAGEERVRVVTQYRDVFREIETHAPTSQECARDPRIVAAFDGIERLHPDKVRASAR